jgi:hypothetical protein
MAALNYFSPLVVAPHFSYQTSLNEDLTLQVVLFLILARSSPDRCVFLHKSSFVIFLYFRKFSLFSFIQHVLL